MNESKYTINFKATKRLFNLFNLRMTHSINVDVEALEEGISTMKDLKIFNTLSTSMRNLKTYQM